VIIPQGRRPGPWSEIPSIGPPRRVDPRPFWSVMIPTYEADELLEATLRHVLAQDPGPEHMHIEVVDDGSTRADPVSVVERLAPGRVAVFRHPVNLGAPRTFNTCVERALGTWVHLLHGDDVVRPGFYAAYEAHIRSHPCSMAVAQSFRIDTDDEYLGVSPRLPHVAGYVVDPEACFALEHPVDAVSVVVRRDAYERTGGFRPGLVHANDWEMWIRQGRHGRVSRVPGAHAGYRRHAASDSRRVQRSMVYLTDPLDALEVIAEQFDDPAFVSRLRVTTRGRLSAQAFEVARNATDRRARREALRNAWWGWRLQPTFRTTASFGGVVRRLVR